MTRVDTFLLVGCKGDIIYIDDDDAFRTFSVEVGGIVISFRPVDVNWETTKHHKTKYARIEFCRNGMRKKFKMHRILLNANQGQYVDHINHNGLDNRKINIRLATPSQNQQNREVTFGKKYKGTRSAAGGGYYAQINQKTIGRYATEHDAALAYNHAAKELFGEFACLNKIEI